MRWAEGNRLFVCIGMSLCVHVLFHKRGVGVWYGNYMNECED